MSLTPIQASELVAQLTELNQGHPVYVLPVRVVDYSDGTSQKLPKGKWEEAECDPGKVQSLWTMKNGGYLGIHLIRSALVLADQDYDDVPDDLVSLLDANPTFLSESLRRGLPHRWYRNPNPSAHARDRKWSWRGTHIGDLKAKGIGVLGRVVNPIPFADLPSELDRFTGAGESVADGSLRLLVTAWINWLDVPPTREDSLAWVTYTLTELEQAQPGHRNNNLYRAARDVAQLCAAGALEPQDGAQIIYDAASLVFSAEELMTEVRMTIESAFEKERRAE